MKVIYRTGDLQMTAGGTFACGDVVRTPDGRAGVVKGLNPAGSGGDIAVEVSGLVDVATLLATEFAVGDRVFWNPAGDSGAGAAVGADAVVEGCIYLGVCVRACTNADTWVRTALNVQPGGDAGFGAGLVRTLRVEVDHADTEPVEILSAENNPTGLILLGFWGEVSEVMAGSSQDQLIIGLYEEDNATAVSTVTASDAAADAVGDIIQGTKSVMRAATGDILGKVAAGKAVLVNVAQATAGGTPAGKMLVEAVFLAR